MPSWPSTPRPNLFQNATFPVTAHQSTSSLLPLGVISHSPPKRPSFPQFHLYRSHLPTYFHCTTSLTPSGGSAIVWLSGFPKAGSQHIQYSAVHFHISQTGIISRTDDHILPCITTQNDDRTECLGSWGEGAQSVGGDKSLQMAVSGGQLGDEGVSDLWKVSSHYLIFFIRYSGANRLCGLNLFCILLN